MICILNYLLCDDDDHDGGKVDAGPTRRVPNNKVSLGQVANMFVYCLAFVLDLFYMVALSAE